MPSSQPTSLFAILCAVALGGVAACGNKAAPKSTTTTNTHTTTTTDTGETSTSDVEETRTTQPDGSVDVERRTTTKKKVPKAEEETP